ncbi:BolA family transcriptional regulator [Burkholderiaceae bacterium DAT-1]|nr:BolA family transcriptional regulator [Burkholderiaceae bacterium DAT-1]
MNTIEQIHAKLASLNPLSIEVLDDSALHAGHAGAGNGGHYTLKIVSPQFAGVNTLSRHRLIYGALGDMMQRDIHALAIEARAPEELFD